jgi:hypothetical protein
MENENKPATGIRLVIGIDNESPVIGRLNQEIGAKIREYAKKYDLTIADVISQLIDSACDKEDYIEGGGKIFGKSGETFRVFHVLKRNEKTSQEKSLQTHS